MPDTVQNNLSLEAAISRLREKAQEFNLVYIRLIKSKPVAASQPLFQEYLKLRERGDKIRGSINAITALIDNAANTLSGVWAVPVALTMGAVLGGISVMSLWISDNAKYFSKLEQVKDLIENKGISPEDAYYMSFGRYPNYLLWAIAGIIGVVIAPKLLKLVKG